MSYILLTQVRHEASNCAHWGALTATVQSTSLDVTLLCLKSTLLMLRLRSLLRNAA